MKDVRDMAIRIVNGVDRKDIHCSKYKKLYCRICIFSHHYNDHGDSTTCSGKSREQLVRLAEEYLNEIS